MDSACDPGGANSLLSPKCGPRMPGTFRGEHPQQLSPRRGPTPPCGTNKISAERASSRSPRGDQKSPRGANVAQQPPQQFYPQGQSNGRCDWRAPAGGTPSGILDLPLANQGPSDRSPRSFAPSDSSKSNANGSKCNKLVQPIAGFHNLNGVLNDSTQSTPRSFASQLREHEERMASILERQRHMVVADVVRSLDKFTADFANNIARSLDERNGSAKVKGWLPSSPTAPVAAPTSPAKASSSPLTAVPMKSKAQAVYAEGSQSKHTVLDDLEESLKVERPDDLEGQAFRLRLRHAEITLGSWARYLVHFDRWWSSLKEPERSGPFYDILCSHKFEALCTIVIIINAIFICYTTNRNIKPENLGARANGFMVTVEVLFILFYTIEMTLKCIVHRHFLFIANDAIWNFFEVFLIVFAIADQLLERAAPGQESVNMLFLRSLRLFKVFRLLRAFHMVKELRLMLDCVIGCFSSLFWAIVMLTFFMGIFSLIFVQGVASYLEARDNLDESSVDALYRTFGSVQIGMMTLFKAATGGSEWSNAYEVIKPTGVFYTSSYIFFIVFFMISVWNIVTSLFIEKALGLAQPDMANMMYEQQKQDISDSEELLQLMRSADKDHSGSISLDEFLQCYHQEDFRSFFHIRGIDIKDGALFFKLLATIGGSEEVDLSAFVTGCMRLKGSASGLDAHLLRYQVLQLHRFCEYHFAQLSGKSTEGMTASCQSLGVTGAVACPLPAELPKINSANSPRGLDSMVI